MRDFTFLIFFLTLIPSNSIEAQSTYYYKLDRIVKKGVVNRNVSGGQFITFTDKSCYESDRNGYSVNNGKMNYRYTENGISIYSGDCYWGSSSLFLFNSDKSALNVKVNDNETYVYKRNNPPVNINTCSLIRNTESRSGSSNRGGIISPSIPIMPDNPQGGYAGSVLHDRNNTGGSTGNSRTVPNVRQPQKKECRLCHGTGKCQTCNGTGWVVRMGIGHSGYCGVCSNHNGRCFSCNGRGVWYE